MRVFFILIYLYKIRDSQRVRIYLEDGDGKLE